MIFFMWIFSWSSFTLLFLHFLLKLYNSFLWEGDFGSLLVWLCCSLFCAINTPAFPGLFVLIFLGSAQKSKNVIVWSVSELFLAGNGPCPSQHLLPGTISCQEAGSGSSFLVERGWEAPEDRDLGHSCLAAGPQLSQQWHLCLLKSGWNRKIPFLWNYLIKARGEFPVAVHSCVTFAVKHHFHTCGVFMDPVDFFLSPVRLSFPSAATSGFDIMRNKVEHFFRAVYSIANIFRNFLLFSNKI